MNILIHLSGQMTEQPLNYARVISCNLSNISIPKKSQSCFCFVLFPHVTMICCTNRHKHQQKRDMSVLEKPRAISHPVSPFQWWWPSSKPPLKLCIFMDFFFNSQQTKYHNSGLILFRNSPLGPEFYFPTHSTPWTGKGIGLD